MEPHAAIAVGASAGGLAALRSLVGGMPADLPAAIFVVQHLYPYSKSALPALLSDAGNLPAVYAEDDAPVEPGRIYVAPPNRHLRVAAPGVMSVRYGPRENLQRPAIDPLFRSVARLYGRRAVGVLLSGTMDDGVAGMTAIKLRQGCAIVQEPADAEYPDLPLNALASVPEIDHVALASAMAGLLTEAVGTMLDHSKGSVAPPEPGSSSSRLGLEGEEGTYACPNCGGPMRPEIHGPIVSYRCRVGHAFSPQSLHSAQADEIEEALWTALQLLRTHVELSLRMADRMKDQSPIRNLKKEYEEQAAQTEEHAKVIYRLLEEFGKRPVTPPGD